MSVKRRTLAKADKGADRPSNSVDLTIPRH